MRRVRNQKARSCNPGLMFAAGVEQIISDHMSHNTSYDLQQPAKSEPAAVKHENRGNLFTGLLRQFSY